MEHPLTMMTGQGVRLGLLLATLSLLLPYTLQHKFRNVCPCATLPQEELSRRQVVEEVRSTRKHELHCCPHSLLGFPAHHYHNASFNITWTFNGKDYYQGWGKNSFKVKYCDLETLESRAVREGDAGLYTCTVTASNGTSVHRNISICVNINEDIHQLPTKARFPQNTKILQGESVSFPCSAYVGRLSCLRQENHSIAWTKELTNGSWIPVDQLPDTKTLTSENEDGKIWSNLDIQSVQRVHFGRYRCTVSNQHGDLYLNVTLVEGVTDMVHQRMVYQAVLLVIMMAVIAFLLVGAYAWPPCRMTIALYYSKKTSHGSPPEGFQQDVFVVHGDSASCWVWTVLLPMLEDTCGYTCFLPQRDMCGGELMIEAMLKAVAKSRWVVVVMTPCLLGNPWAAWAIHQAMNAALKKRARILALVLKEPRIEEGIPDTSGILKILSLVKKIRVPLSCGWREDEFIQDPPPSKSLKKAKKVTIKATQSTKRLDSSLVAPGGGDRTFRSRSRSPKSQRVSNMISAINAVSRENLDTAKNKKKKPGDPVTFTEEEFELLDQGSPCSVTSFISHSRRKNGDVHTQASARQSSYCCCLKIPCIGNEEEMFWQTVRFHLGLPAFRRPNVEVYKR